MSRICAADDCKSPYDPVLPEQMFCSDRCATRMRMRRWRKAKKNGPGGGGGKRRQLALFAKQSISAKRVKEPRPETAPLFTMLANGKHEKHVPQELELVPDFSTGNTCSRTLEILSDSAQSVESEADSRKPADSAPLEPAPVVKSQAVAA